MIILPRVGSVSSCPSWTDSYLFIREDMLNFHTEGNTEEGAGQCSFRCASAIRVVVKHAEERK